jgi:hypothetical protein
MWKIAVGFVIFAAVALFALMKAGDKVDMGGEKHDTGAHSAPATTPSVTPTTVPAAAAATQPSASASAPAVKP